ncbi:MAG: hypothetical protein ACRBDI_01225 [Alphaproteobacteria bacterium]
MSLEDEIALSVEFLQEFKTEADDEFGGVVKRIRDMSFEAEFVVNQDDVVRDEYLSLFDKLISFAGEQHQATDKILPAIGRVQESFENYNPPWKRASDSNEFTL